MEKEGKERRPIPNTGSYACRSVFSMFPNFPFFLIAQAVTSFGCSLAIIRIFRRFSLCCRDSSAILHPVIV